MTENLTEEKGATRVYEAAYLVSPNIAEASLPEVVGGIRSVLEKHSSFVISDDFPKFRSLAYELIKPLGGDNERYTTAYFGSIKFEAPTEVIAHIQTELERNVNLIRFLIVKTERENQTVQRVSFVRKETIKRDSPKAEGKVSGSMSEAEIDKTIEELLVE